MSATVHFVVPDSIDDPVRVSGGNLYDRRVRDGLLLAGWDVRMVPVADAAGAATLLSDLSEDALVLIDGLIAVRESEAMLAHANRLRFVVLAHMVASLIDETTAPSTDGTVADHERDAQGAARFIIATSEWTRSTLIARSLAEPGDVVVARPGTDPAGATVQARHGGRLLCVGVVAPHKGQDLLAQALSGLADLPDWTCTIVGSLTTEPDYAAELTRTVERAGLTTRVSFTGVLDRSAIDAAYGRADLVVIASRAEGFGMVAAEALARGIPVIAANVGGLPEAIGHVDAALLVPPDDAPALEGALRAWCTDPSLRGRLSTAALTARESARPWSDTVAVVAAALDAAADSGFASADRASTAVPA